MTSSRRLASALRDRQAHLATAECWSSNRRGSCSCGTGAGSPRAGAPRTELPPAVVAALEKTGKGRIWILSTHGLWWKALGETVLSIRLPTPRCPPAAAIGTWRRMEKGAFGSRPCTASSTSAILYGHLSLMPRGMPTKSAAQVLVDREGSLWYASNGLFRQLGLGALYNQTTREGLPTEIVWAVSRDLPRGACGPAPTWASPSKRRGLEPGSRIGERPRS